VSKRSGKRTLQIVQARRVDYATVSDEPGFHRPGSRNPHKSKPLGKKR
jgi:hypothetical protein